MLRSIGKSLKQFSQMPQPPSSFIQTGSDNLILDETSYNMIEMEQEFCKRFKNSNTKQLEVYNAVFNLVKRNQGGVFFVYGSGGRHTYGKL